jgi:hypothetical protein
LNKLIRYDENFNNKRKVLFESSLAGIVLNHPRMLFSFIEKVASAVLPDFNVIFKNYIISNVSKHCYAFFYNNPNIQAAYSGYYGARSLESKQEANYFIHWVQNTLSSQDEKTAYNKLLLILKYGHFFIRSYINLKKFESTMDINIIPNGLGNEVSKRQMKEWWSALHVNWPSNPVTHQE